jgi:hypothetical protein
MAEFCSGMPPSYSQLKPESTASHIAAARQLKDGDEGASKPEFWPPFLPVYNVSLYNVHGLAGSADPDVSYVIASQGKMADAIGFSVR